MTNDIDDPRPHSVALDAESVHGIADGLEAIMNDSIDGVGLIPYEATRSVDRLPLSRTVAALKSAQETWEGDKETACHDALDYMAQAVRYTANGITATDGANTFRFPFELVTGPPLFVPDTAEPVLEGQ